MVWIVAGNARLAFGLGKIGVLKDRPADIGCRKIGTRAGDEPKKEEYSRQKDAEDGRPGKHTGDIPFFSYSSIQKISSTDFSKRAAMRRASASEGL